MKDFIQKTFKGQVFLTLVALIIGVTVVMAASDLAYFLTGISGNGFRVPVGITARIDTDKIVGTSVSGCKLVTNNGTADIFVPTNSANEWDTFVNNHPASVTLSPCLASCTYSFGPVLTVCSKHDNTPPFSPIISNGICDATTAGQYLVVNQTADSNCNVDTPSMGNHTHYEYKVCGSVCSSGAPVVNGTCGGAATGYTSSASFPAGAFCSSGSASPTSPSDPVAGGSTSWTCNGSGGGGGSTCSATRAAAPTYSWVSVSGTCTAPGGTSATCDASNVGKVLNGSITSVPLSCPGNQPKFSYQVCTAF